MKGSLPSVRRAQVRALESALDNVAGQLGEALALAGTFKARYQGALAGQRVQAERHTAEERALQDRIERLEAEIVKRKDDEAHLAERVQELEASNEDLVARIAAKADPSLPVARKVDRRDEPNGTPCPIPWAKTPEGVWPDQEQAT